MAAQVALEVRTDVVQLVEQRDELVVEILIEKARQVERHEVEHLASVDEVALDLIQTAAAAPSRQLAVTKTQRRDARLQAVSPAAARCVMANSKRDTSMCFSSSQCRTMLAHRSRMWPEKSNG